MSKITTFEELLIYLDDNKSNYKAVFDILTDYFLQEIKSDKGLEIFKNPNKINFEEIVGSIYNSLSYDKQKKLKKIRYYTTDLINILNYKKLRKNYMEIQWAFDKFFSSSHFKNFEKYFTGISKTMDINDKEYNSYQRCLNLSLLEDIELFLRETKKNESTWFTRIDLLHNVSLKFSIIKDTNQLKCLINNNFIQKEIIDNLPSEISKFIIESKQMLPKYEKEKKERIKLEREARKKIKKDKEFHQRLNELKDLWLKEFNLKSLENDYIPKLPQEVKDYIGNLDMKITQGSFIKLLLKNREDMISFIKPTIENPNFALDNGRGILFIKEFTDENKNTYFMSVAKNYDGEWIFASHTRRELENVKNEIKNSKIIINKGFERSEVAGACDILESGGEVSKPSHLQIKYTANQDFGTNPPNDIIPQSQQKQNTFIFKINPNDSSAMDELRREYQESKEQVESEQETQIQQDDNVRRQK